MTNNKQQTTNNPLLLSQLLNKLVAGEVLTDVEWQQLTDETLTPPQRAKSFDITPENVEERIQIQFHILQAVYSDILLLPSFSPKIHEDLATIDPAKILSFLWTFWIPLTIQLSTKRQQLDRPLIQGILGAQGTGKTTLAAVLKLILAYLGYSTLSLSLDDLYKTYEERQRLRQQDPRLIWRGPPGTHDIELGLQVLDQLRSPHYYHSILVPRFDKSAWNGAGDRTVPETVQGIDIVLFEGWFVGARPINSTVFDTLTLAPIETDADRVFARDMNEQLKNYLPLWERLDQLMILYPKDYRFSQTWRLQAEQQMVATGKSGMNSSEVCEFVKYFWKSLHPQLFITPLLENPNVVNLVIEINFNHSPGAIYRPKDRVV